MLAITKPMKQEEIEFFPCQEKYKKDIFKWNDDQNKLKEIVARNWDFFKISINWSDTVLSPWISDIIFRYIDSWKIYFLEIREFHNRYRELFSNKKSTRTK